MNQSGVLVPRALYHTAEVEEVRFSALTGDEIEMLSVLEVTQPKIYDGGVPVQGGVNDPRLGIIKAGQRCITCGQSKDCQGHFGHIKLARPVFHVGYLPFVERILKCVCHNCGKLKYFGTEGQKDKMDHILRIGNPSKRLKELVYMLGHINRCAADDEDSPNKQSKEVGCGSVIPVKITIKEKTKLMVVDKQDKQNKGQVEYSALRVKHIFDKINDHDRRLLGFKVTRPNDLLVHVLAVAPPQMRPSVELGPQKRAQDDITNAYSRIVNLNRQLLQNPDSHHQLLMLRDITKIVASIMVKMDKNQIPNLKEKVLKKKPMARKIKSIQQRLISKQGRFRQHLMGKRVDFSARSVISPDPYLDLDEVGVPEKIAKGLTIPQEINEFNFEKIIDLCKKGSIKYFLQPQVGKRTPNFIYLNSLQKPQDIAKYMTFGTIAERQLQNGDYILFNRQPTLHRMSMMAHRVRILPMNTFRLNLSVCSPYNADFDGDEMNMHVPQSVEAIAELKHIARVQKQVISPKNSTPVMGIVQDSLLGMFHLTRRDTFLTKEQLMNLLVWVEPNRKYPNGDIPLPCIIKPEPLWSGKQVISYLIPKKMSLKLYKNENLRNIDDRGGLLIRKGQLIFGSLQKQHIGPGTGALIHALWIELNPEITKQFITNSQKIVTNWLMNNSFSVGAADVIIDSEMDILRLEEIEQIKKDYFKNIHMFRNLPLYINQNLHQRGRKVTDSLQFKVNLDLNNALSRMQRNLSDHVAVQNNNIYRMITARSKGSETNLVQIMFCLGNQNVDGQRCPLGFRGRALPHFWKNDNSPQPRGFVFSSFFQGLKPHEFFFHSMAGRQGLSDTAVKTSSIGYIQRKLVKALEDLSIHYDASVRDSQGNMLQKFYGQDGFQTEYIQKHKFNDVKMSKEDFLSKYHWTSGKSNDLSTIKIALQSKELLLERKLLRERIMKERGISDVEYHAPINILRLVNKVQEYDPRGERATPIQVIQSVNELADECVLPQFKKSYDRDMAKLHQWFKNNFEANKGQEHIDTFLELFVESKDEIVRESGMQMFHLHLRVWLNSMKVCKEFRLTKKQLELLCKEIKVKFRQAIAPSGEAIGSLAAQSIGQPTTQMTLNTFHLAGVSGKNVTLGIPRLRQLLDVSKKIKTPCMTIYYHQRLMWEDHAKASFGHIHNQLMSMIPERRIGDYIANTRIFYDPGEQYSQIDNFQFLDMIPERTAWVLRLIFITEKVASTLVWRNILEALHEHYDKDYEILECEGIGVPNRAPQIQMTLHYSTQQRLRDCNGYRHLSQREAELKDIFVSGMPGIKSIKTGRRISYEYKQYQAMNLALENRQDELVFDTVGSNLRQCLSNFYLNPIKTTTNNLYQIYQVLGIQAARQSFMNQIAQVLKPYSIYINNRHLAVLADWMTYRGSVTPVNRHGINRVRDVSILRKASFEETMDILYTAAAFAETDHLRGVSEKIIFGEKVNLGTNACQIFVNPDRVGKYVYQPMTNIPQQSEEQVEKPAEGQQTPKGLMTPELTFNTSQEHSPAVSFTQSPSYSNRSFSQASSTPRQVQFNSSDSPNYNQSYMSSHSQEGFHPNMSLSPSYAPQLITQTYQEKDNKLINISHSPSYEDTGKVVRPTHDPLKEEDSDSEDDYDQ